MKQTSVAHINRNRSSVSGVFSYNGIGPGKKDFSLSRRLDCGWVVRFSWITPFSVLLQVEEITKRIEECNAFEKQIYTKAANVEAISQSDLDDLIFNAFSRAVLQQKQLFLWPPPITAISLRSIRAWATVETSMDTCYSLKIKHSSHVGALSLIPSYLKALG